MQGPRRVVALQGIPRPVLLPLIGPDSRRARVPRLDPWTGHAATLLAAPRPNRTDRPSGSREAHFTRFPGARPRVFDDAATGPCDPQQRTRHRGGPRSMTGIGRVEPGLDVVCTVVDVFAERPLSGNQLAVIRGGAHLDTVTMCAGPPRRGGGHARNGSGSAIRTIVRPMRHPRPQDWLS